MNINFRKISAVLTSGIMAFSGVGFAAAVNYPAPFVSSGVADVAVVYGVNAQNMDTVQAGNIQTNLQSKMSGSGSSSATSTGGESVMIDGGSTNRFNLMDNMTDFFTKIDDSELSTVLAKGEYTNDAHDTFDYQQEIVLGYGIQLKHFLDSDFNDDKPVIGFDLSSGQELFNYTLKFTPNDAQGGTSWASISNSYLPLLGKEYYVLSMTNTSATNHKITLLNAAVDGDISETESVTLTAGDKTYDVSIGLVTDGSVKLIINGETTDSLGATETQKLSDGSYVGIKEVNYVSKETGVSQVSFSIGSGKLVLENEKEVELNSDKLSDTKYDVEGSDETVSYNVYSYITTSGADLDSVKIQWTLDDDSWIAPGTEMVLPGFESVKIGMSSFLTDKSEKTTIKGDSNKLTVSTTLTDGDIELNILYLNSTSSGIEGLGKDSTHRLVTSNVTGGTSLASAINVTLNETLNNYFAITWVSGDDHESYVYKLSSVDEDDSNKTILESMISGGTDIAMDEVGDTETVGNVKFTLAFAHEKYPSKAYAIVSANAASSGSVYTNKIVTAEGLQLRLPVNNNAITTDGYINLTAVPETWTMNITEEDRNGNIATGPSVTFAMATDGTTGIEPGTVGGALSSATMYETEDDSNKYIGYVPSDLATFFSHDKPTSGLNELEITYHGGEAYGEIYVAETGVIVTPGTSGTSGSSATLGSLFVTDAEVSSVSSKNLIIVGGSCINSAAANVLGVSANTCGAAFTAATGVGSGQFLIKGVSGAYSTGKIALVVAGYEAADTANAATYLITQTVDTSKEYKGTSSSSAEMVVANAEEDAAAEE
jgi:hypothetical protein